MVLQVEIIIPRPKMLLFWIALIVAGVFWVRWLNAPAESDAAVVRTAPAAQQEDVQKSEEAVGGRKEPTPAEKRAMTGRIVALRGQADLLSHRADILRYQLELLEREREAHPGDEAAQKAWEDRREALMSLLSDERAAEDELTEALLEMQDAEDDARAVSRTRRGSGPVAFSWPVEPMLGISAWYHDADYLARFGVPHNAIDIPVDQGSTIYAAADGVVEKATDHGMGYNSITISHNDGYATLYGPVSEFLVKAGDTVRRGDPIGKSGGAPHTPGAGLLSTGPHVHFEVFENGEHVNPIDLLPRRNLGA